MKVERTWVQQQDGSIDYRMSATLASDVKFGALYRVSRQEMRMGCIPPIEEHLRTMILDAIRRELFP